MDLISASGNRDGRNPGNKVPSSQKPESSGFLYFDNKNKTKKLNLRRLLYHMEKFLKH